MLSYVFMDMIRAIAVSIGELYSMYVLPITTKGDTSVNKYITMNKIFDSQRIEVCGKCFHDFHSSSKCVTRLWNVLVNFTFPEMRIGPLLGKESKPINQ